MTRTLAVLVYPCTLILVFALHTAALAAGWPVLAGAYLAVAVGAACTIGLERVLPHRTDWRAAPVEIGLDALYLICVQMALPSVLTLTATICIATCVGPDAALFDWWPHAAPMAAQVVLVLLTADLLRYGLHVAAHRLPFLWRLHAVHHAPRVLYWLNVARFHPLEKALQFLLDTLPFLLLGICPEVLAGYFVFYAVHGFFQHSNANVRLGWLNWIVSGPELHRWHHSECPSESRANYGNNLIVWDVVFGTRVLPRHRRVARLGIPRPRSLHSTA